MKNELLVEATKFCHLHNVEISFVRDLKHFELIEISEENDTSYLIADQLPKVEMLTRLYADLGINVEGLDAIRHLLEKMDTMRSEINDLKKRLNLFEDIP